MKSKIISYILFICSVFTMTSCLNDDYLYDYENQKPVIELPYVNHSMNLTYKKGSTSVTTPLYVNYSIADWRNINEEIPVTVGIDESSLPNGTKMLPASSYNLTFPLTLTIKKASDIDPTDRSKLNNQSAQTDLTIDLTNSELVSGETYALPLIIESAPSQYTLSGNFNKMVFTITIS